VFKAALEASDRVDFAGTLRGAVNAALRSLCGSVEVDYSTGNLVLHFLHGGAVAVTYAYRFETRAGGCRWEPQGTGEG
jgi:hypothetical protein